MGRGLGAYLVVVDPSDPMGGGGGGGGGAADGTLGLSASMGRRRRGAGAAAGRLQSATVTKVEGE